MRFLPFAILAACVALAGCLGGEDETAQPGAEASTALPECPGGDEDLRSATFDLGENPQGAPTARGALEQFLLERKSELRADAFERTDRGSDAVREVGFSYSRNGFRLATVYVERLEGGWLVIAYANCEGIF